MYIQKCSFANLKDNIIILHSYIETIEERIYSLFMIKLYKCDNHHHTLKCSNLINLFVVLYSNKYLMSPEASFNLLAL